MNFKKLTAISAAAFAILVIAAFFLTSQAAPTVKGQITWVPNTYTWDNPPPNPWIARIGLNLGHKAVTEINQTTLLLAGLYTPIGPGVNYGNGTKLFVPFSGNDVKAAIGDQLPLHMGILTPGTYWVVLTITGNLYSGLPFTATGPIQVTIDLPPPP